MTFPSLRTADDCVSSPPGSSLEPVIVRRLEKKDTDRWDRFVFAQPDGTFFHQVSWMRVLERTFGHQSQYAYAERDGSMVGIVPTFLVSNWMVGRALISSPLASYGGICASDPAAERALLEFLKVQAKEQKVDYLELRNQEGEVKPQFVANPLYSDFSMSLAGSSDEVLNALPKDIRYMIRKAKKADLQIKRGPEYLDVFYHLFRINMHRLGTPVFPRALFANLLSEFGKQVDVLIVYAGSQPVASAFSFLFRDTMHPYYIGGLPLARDLAANNFLWWELIKFAVEAGMKTFDFGRSKKGTGAYAFKKKWNPEIKDLKYQVFLVRRTTAPNFSPANPKFKAATQIWSHMPLWLANILGPKVVSWLP